MPESDQREQPKEAQGVASGDIPSARSEADLFKTTHWSLVLNAGDPNSPAAREASNTWNVFGRNDFRLASFDDANMS